MIIYSVSYGNKRIYRKLKRRGKIKGLSLLLSYYDIEHDSRYKWMFRYRIKYGSVRCGHSQAVGHKGSKKSKG